MTRRIVWLLVGIIVVLAVGTAAYSLYQRLTASVQVQVGSAPAMSTADATPDADEITAVANQLRAAGLNENPILGDTAVSGHLARLNNSEVTLADLEQYASNLAYLNEYTAGRGTMIPTPFWDVRSSEMSANNWNEYWIVNQIAVPEAEPYLRLLADGYHRFSQFKAAEAVGEDTALDAALDMLLLVDGYYNEVSGPQPEDPEQRQGYAEAKLLVWQSLVAGSTRINPLTNEPMFSHSIYARNNIGTMYQYEIGEEMGISEVWGVSGFHPRFVGIAENNNQIEHMSISTILQVVMDESLSVLNAIEEEKVLAGQADSAEAAADMALNQAIHDEFAPLYAQDSQAAAGALRRYLSGK